MHCWEVLQNLKPLNTHPKQVRSSALVTLEDGWVIFVEAFVGLVVLAVVVFALGLVLLVVFVPGLVLFVVLVLGFV